MDIRSSCRWATLHGVHHHLNSLGPVRRTFFIHFTTDLFSREPPAIQHQQHIYFNCQNTRRRVVRLVGWLAWCSSFGTSSHLSEPVAPLSLCVYLNTFSDKQQRLVSSSVRKFINFPSLTVLNFAHKTGFLLLIFPK